MFRKIFLIMGISFVFVCGCVPSAINTTKSTERPQKDERLVIRPPDLTPGDISRLPGHVKFVIAAMVNKMRGGRIAIPEVVFDPQGKHLFYDENFTYDDFTLTAVYITGFDIKKQTKTEANMVIEGIFGFRDLFGRKVADYFAADYTVRKSGIIINKSATALIAPRVADLEVYYVPKSSFESVNMNEISSYLDLYIHAITHALNLTPTREERIRKQEYEKLSLWKKITFEKQEKPEGYFIMAFCKDRLPPEASLEMRILDTATFTETTPEDLLVVDDQGWRVLIFGGSLFPTSLSNNFQISYWYSPRGVQESKPICLGIYTNQKNYYDTQRIIYSKKSTGTTGTTTLTPSPSKKTPIESAAVFLDPRKRPDAQKIQARLKELGYYKGRIDGLFGKGSRKALKKFKKDHQLGDNYFWNLETQKALFKGTGL